MEGDKMKIEQIMLLGMELGLSRSSCYKHALTLNPDEQDQTIEHFKEEIWKKKQLALKNMTLVSQ